MGSESVWHPPVYDKGKIDGEYVVLVKGGITARANARLSWRVYATLGRDEWTAPDRVNETVDALNAQQAQR